MHTLAAYIKNHLPKDYVGQFRHVNNIFQEFIVLDYDQPKFEGSKIVVTQSYNEYHVRVIEDGTRVAKICTRIDKRENRDYELVSSFVNRFVFTEEIWYTPIPYRKEELAPKDYPWDGDKEMDAAYAAEGVDGLFRMCAWYSIKYSENKNAYKLPHHAYANGKYLTVWRGVVAAMQSLLGTRGGAKIPKKERKEIYEHLAKHYREFDEQPPEFKG
ncbi:hypothetical protein JYU20_00420 [Bacteroidales bacterium AH-315-I05]|nr:hypothetical protein [Bacteroidales bacterium AH-315-I05]